MQKRYPFQFFFTYKQKYVQKHLANGNRDFSKVEAYDVINICHITIYSI